MNHTLLLGRDVKVRADGLINSDSFARVINISEHERKLLLELAAPITISGVIFTHAIVSPRLARDDLNVLLDKGVLGCALTWVPKERFDQTKPLDLSWWRGGPAAITDVLLIDL